MLFTAYYIKIDHFINISLLPCSTVAICEFKKGMLLNDDSKLSVVIRNRFSLEKFFLSTYIDSFLIYFRCLCCIVKTNESYSCYFRYLAHAC